MFANIASVAATFALVAGFWWQGERFFAASGPTFDEAAHLAAGYAYWTTGNFRLNCEHPPLMKLLWATPLLIGDRPPFPHDVAEATNFDHWHVGAAFLYDSGVPHQQVLTPARRVNLAVGCGVVLLAGWWAFRLWHSRLAALAAVAFATFDPTLLALSCVLSTDVGLTFFALLSCYLLWEYTAAPSRGLMLATGISLGLMLATKLSALGMVAGLGAAGFVYVLRGGMLGLPGGVSPRDFAFRLGIIALVTVAATYGFVHFDQWGRGLKFQLTRQAFGDGNAYLCGEVARGGWYHYFLVALPLKLPLGLLAASGASIVLASRGCQPPVLRTCWLVVPPLVFFLAASVSRVNLGVRVVLPVLPFLYILAARLAVPGCGRAVRLVLLAGCLGWSVVAAWHAAPHQIAYFNELADGPAGGMRSVADSNLDWGQGLPELAAYLRRERLDVVYLSYFGTDRPEAYGIRFHPLPGYGRVGPNPVDEVPPDAPRHVVAVSANNLLGIYLNDPDTFAWLRDRPPTAIVGGCVFVFDLTGDPAAIRRVRETR